MTSEYNIKKQARKDAETLNYKGGFYYTERSRSIYEEAFNERMEELEAEKPTTAEQDWETPCCNCGGLPTVLDTELCGPCCFGEADTAGGNW